MKLTMPDASILYRLAKVAKDKAKQMPTEALEDHLNEVGNGYLRANTLADKERTQ
jgi:hypothetical protein